MANRYYNVTTRKFNLSAIMKDAWARITVRNNLKQRIALSLSIIWAQAKAEKAANGRSETENKVVKLEDQIFMLRNRETSRTSFSNEIAALNAEIMTLKRAA